MNLKSKNFDLNTALWLAKFSRMAYGTKDNISEELEKLDFKKVIFFDNSGTQAFVALRHDFAVLAFRGTEKDYKDILSDIRFNKKKTLDGKFMVHAGFLGAINYVWVKKIDFNSKRKIEVELGNKGIDSYLEKLTIPLFITGHSLGGALATLASYRYNKSTTYTFGSPRVVCRELSHYLSKNNNIFRVVNSTDVVTWVPMPFGYKHSGKLIYIDEKGAIWKQNSKTKELYEALFKILSLTILLLPNSSVKMIKPKLFVYHKIEEYIKNLDGKFVT